MTTAYFDTLVSHARSLRADMGADMVVKAAALVATLLLIGGYFGLLTLPIYGHDEVHYYVDFHFKLVEDGRWLNYLLHHFLRKVPLPIWSVLYLVLCWSFLYRLVRLLDFDMPFAALVASSMLLASPFWEISTWPASMVPGLLLSWLALSMRARGMPYKVIYVVSGVLMFGTVQTLYFLLPLLFLREFLDTAEPVVARLQLLFQHMLWWVAGSVAGVIVVCLMLWLLAGTYFPQPAPWRNTQPVVDGVSLVANIGYVIDEFKSLFNTLLDNGGVSIGVVAICAVAALLRARTLLAQAPGLLLMGAVLISFFVFSIPLAPVLHMRSLLAMAVVVILIVAILPGQSPLGRVLAAALMLNFAEDFSELSQKHLEAQRAETAMLMATLRELFAGYPASYSTLALRGNMDPARPEARRFNDGSMMRPMAASLGVWDFRDCKMPTVCDGIGTGGEPINVLPFGGGYLELLVDSATNTAIVSFRPPTEQASR